MSLDLFRPRVPTEKFHPSFKAALEDRYGHNRAVLERWATGFVDRDGKFVTEFQTTFDSSFWELYLHAALTELGLSCDFRYERPDFHISSPLCFNVEATVALNAKGTPSVTETSMKDVPTDFNEFNRQAIIRLSNSMHSKYKKYVESYSQLAHVKGKPFVVALAPFDRPHFQFQGPRAIEALLYKSYVDEEAYLKKHPNRDVALRPAELSHVKKDSGEILPLGLFLDSSMPEVSAVIQSTGGTWSKVTAMSEDPDVIVTAIFENRAEGGQYIYKGPNGQYSECILDGLRVYHNPHATCPLDPGLFDRPEIFQATCRAPARLVNMSDSRRLLVNRTAMSIPVGMMEKTLAEMPSSSARQFWHYVR